MGDHQFESEDDFEGNFSISEGQRSSSSSNQVHIRDDIIQKMISLTDVLTADRSDQIPLWKSRKLQSESVTLDANAVTTVIS
jgi:hypothetical protein